MACTQYTLAQYTDLSAAIASGALSVKYGDKEVTYRNLADMRATLVLMERCLFPERFTNNGKTFATFSKGTFPRGNRRRC